MFGKKKENQPKEHTPSPREQLNEKITAEIDGLDAGQSLIYQIPEFFTFARFLIVEPNPTFPQKGKKYLMFTDMMAEGKPSCNRHMAGSTNKALDAADWIVSRDTDQYGHVIRLQ